MAATAKGERTRDRLVACLYYALGVPLIAVFFYVLLYMLGLGGTQTSARAIHPVEVVHPLGWSIEYAILFPFGYLPPFFHSSLKTDVSHVVVLNGLFWGFTVVSIRLFFLRRKHKKT